MTLQDTIKEQATKLIRYEKRLNDVLTAYKGVLREKNALQSTLEALHSSPPPPPEPQSKSGGETSDDDSTETTASDATAAVAKHNKDATDKISKLSSSLATLMSEKSNMENKYLLEKRLIKKEFATKLEENEVTIGKMKAHLDRLDSRDKAHGDKVKQLQDRVIREQGKAAESDLEHSLLFREVQDLLAAERIVRVQLEKQLEQNERLTCEPDQTSYIATLERDLSDVSTRMRYAEQGLLEQRDMYDRTLVVTEQEFRQALTSEKVKVADRDAQLVEMTDRHERLTSGLERNINELTSAVADTAKSDMDHRHEVEQLNEKLSRLVDDNSLLSLRCHSDHHGDETESTRGDTCRDTDDADGVTTTVEEDRLQAKITECCSRLAALGCDPDSLHTDCTQRYQRLSNSLEQYKSKSAELIKQLSNDDYDVNVELSKLKNDLSNCRGEIDTNRREDSIRHREDVDKLKADQRVKESHAHLEHCKELASLRQEMSSQRERTLDLLKEKDRDIEVARSNKGIPKYERAARTAESYSLTNSANANEQLPPQMHYLEEIGRLENECRQLRRDKHEWRSEARTLSRETGGATCKLRAELDLLKEQLRDGARSVDRGRVNVDYVKNVVFALLSKPGGAIGGKQGHLVAALATALHFSKEERSAVDKRLAADGAGWWK